VHVQSRTTCLRLARISGLLFALAAGPVRAAAQQLHVVPYFGATFGGSSALLADLEGGSRESASVLGVSAVRLSDGWVGLEADLGHAPGFFEGGSRESASVLGVSAVRLSDGWVGLEADLGHAPGFFERGQREIVLPGSYVTTLTASAVATLPVRITRESLRPYLIVGGGALRARARDLTGVFSVLSTMPVVAVGGGATGFVSNAFGLRFDVRQFRSLGRGDDALALDGPRVRYWRGSIGLVFRY